MLHQLLSERARWERVQADRTLIPNVVEETLRYDPPLYWVPRKAAADVKLAGVKIAAGAMVCNAVGHANRDLAGVERPNEWDMDRLPREPNPSDVRLRRALLHRLVAGTTGGHGRTRGAPDRLPDLTLATRTPTSRTAR